MTPVLVVSDSSTLILLVKAELIDRIVQKFGVFIPPIVFEESVLRGREKGRWDALRIERLVIEKRIKTREPSGKNLEKVSTHFNLHKGELHAIALALDLGAEFLLTDDLKAMNACKVLNIRFVNAISLLFSLSEKNELPKKEAVAAIQKLEDFGWYASGILNDFKRRLEEVKE